MYCISSNSSPGRLFLFFFCQGRRLIEGGRLFEGGGGGGGLIQMRGSNVQSLVKNGSQTSLDSKAFILLHVMQLKCSAGSQIPHCRHRVTGQILGGLAFGDVFTTKLWDA